MEIRDLIGALRLLIVLGVLAIIGLTSFAITNYDSLQAQPKTAVVIDTGKTAQKSVSRSAAEQLPGFKLFNEWNCYSCHDINKKVVGPPLKDIRVRRSDEWLIKFIQSPAKVIASGDAYAVKLYEQYKPTMMQNHDLSDEEVTSILDYITEASK